MGLLRLQRIGVGRPFDHHAADDEADEHDKSEETKHQHSTTDFEPSEPVVGIQNQCCQHDEAEEYSQDTGSHSDWVGDLVDIIVRIAHNSSCGKRVGACGLGQYH